MGFCRKMKFGSPRSAIHLARLPSVCVARLGPHCLAVLKMSRDKIRLLSGPQDFTVKWSEAENPVSFSTRAFTSH